MTSYNNNNHYHLPIGVFDSGIGGLTVASMLTHILPNESIIYLGDTARVPYGNKSPQAVIAYAQKCSQFLIQQKIKMLIVACNTVSAVALPALKHLFAGPILGVIEPGIKTAIKLSKHGRIGVIATQGTIKSQAYQSGLTAQGAQVFASACPLFVPIVEEGLETHPVTTLMVKEYLTSMKDIGIDTLILGCTHYPLLKQAIAQFMGENVILCDSAHAISFEAQRLLETTQLSASQNVKNPQHRFFMTDVQPHFETIAKRFFGSHLSIEHTDLI